MTEFDSIIVSGGFIALGQEQVTAYVAVAVAVLWSLLVEGGTLWLGDLSVVLRCGVRAAMAGEEENCREGGGHVACECHIDRRVLRAGDVRSIVEANMKEQMSKQPRLGEKISSRWRGESRSN